MTPECYAFRVTLEPILGFCDASRMGLSLMLPYRAPTAGRSAHKS
jgi:hypothetical protein